MPWNQAQKKVIRDNSRNAGTTVWDLDAQASQPIDSLGHDYHDQDLAAAISECLHIGGYNSMQADLDLGGFKLVGVAPGSQPTDVVTKSQMDAADAALQAQITSNDGELANHEGRITSNEGDLASHNTRINSNDTELADHESRISSNESDLASHNTRINSNDTELAGHETRISNNESDILSHDTRISNVETSGSVPDPLSVSNLTATVAATLKSLQLTSAMNAGGFKLSNIAAGTASTDAVRKSQLDGVDATLATVSGVASSADTKADANTQNITDLKNGTDTATILRTRELNFQNLPLASGAGTQTINLDAGNRQYVNVTGNLTVNLSYSALGSGVFSGDFVIESVILFKNTNGSTITLNQPAANVLGAPNTAAGSRSILTCLVFFDNNTEVDKVFVWSAE